MLLPKVFIGSGVFSTGATGAIAPVLCKSRNIEKRTKSTRNLCLIQLCSMQAKFQDFTKYCKKF